MNRFGPIRYIGMAALLMWAGSMVMAQEPQNDEEQQKQIQEEQMKAYQEQLQQQQQKQEQIMEEQMRARKEMLQQQQEQMRKLEEQYADQARDFERQARDMARVTAPVFIGEVPLGTGNGEPVYVSFGSQNNQSQLTLRKSFREATSSTSKGEFDVDGDIRQFRCTINGTVRSGEIVIAVTYPDGKPFKELAINSSADVNFSQSVSIKEGEEEKYTGSWRYVIKADDAEGNYMLQIMTN